MSNLINAPLNEVIFELRWKSDTSVELNQFQLLLGSMFSSLKDKYPNKESLMPDANLPLVAFIQKPTYRFRSANNVNKMFQIGPGVLSFNFVGQNYDWEDFRDSAKDVISIFKELFDINNDNDMQIGLSYIDFFHFDFQNNKVIDYLREYMHINIETDLFDTNTISFNSTSGDIEDKTFNIAINTGFRNKIEKGIVVNSKLVKSDKQNIILGDYENILNSFHEELSAFFKKLTDGELYKNLK